MVFNYCNTTRIVLKRKLSFWGVWFCFYVLNFISDAYVSQMSAMKSQLNSKADGQTF